MSRSSGPAIFPRPPLAADRAYVLYYTSGSTGRPKGVVVAHEAIARHCVDAWARYALAPRLRVLQFNSLSFDACV